MLVPREAEFDGGGAGKGKNKLAMMREDASRHSHLQMLANVEVSRRSGGLAIELLSRESRGLREPAGPTYFCQINESGVSGCVP